MRSKQQMEEFDKKLQLLKESLGDGSVILEADDDESTGKKAFNLTKDVVMGKKRVIDPEELSKEGHGQLWRIDSKIVNRMDKLLKEFDKKGSAEKPVFVSESNSYSGVNIVIHLVTSEHMKIYFINRKTGTIIGTNKTELNIEDFLDLIEKSILPFSGLEIEKSINRTKFMSGILQKFAPFQAANKAIGSMKSIFSKLKGRTSIEDIEKEDDEDKKNKALDEKYTTASTTLQVVDFQSLQTILLAIYESELVQDPWIFPTQKTPNILKEISIISKNETLESVYDLKARKLKGASEVPYLGWKLTTDLDKNSFYEGKDQPMVVFVNGKLDTTSGFAIVTSADMDDVEGKDSDVDYENIATDLKTYITALSSDEKKKILIHYTMLAGTSKLAIENKEYKINIKTFAERFIKKDVIKPSTITSESFHVILKALCHHFITTGNIYSVDTIPTGADTHCFYLEKQFLSTKLHLMGGSPAGLNFDAVKNLNKEITKDIASSDYRSIIKFKDAAEYGHLDTNTFFSLFFCNLILEICDDETSFEILYREGKEILEQKVKGQNSIKIAITGKSIKELKVIKNMLSNIFITYKDKPNDLKIYDTQDKSGTGPNPFILKNISSVVFATKAIYKFTFIDEKSFRKSTNLYNKKARCIISSTSDDISFEELQKLLLACFKKLQKIKL